MRPPTPRLMGGSGGRTPTCERTSGQVIHFAYVMRTLGPKDIVYSTWTVAHFVDIDNTVYICAAECQYPHYAAQRPCENIPGSPTVCCSRCR
jgi:hypothetical protein